MRARLTLALALAAAMATPWNANAAGWTRTAAIYGWGTWIDGDSQFGPKESEVDVSAGQVIDALEMGAMARLRFENDRWAFVFDGIYASLGGSTDGPPKVKLDLNQYIFQLDAAYRFGEHAEALFGVRYVRLEATADLGGSGPLGGIHRTGDVSLWDPVVGLRVIAPLRDKWRIQAQGDLGGGANMDFTWQAMVNVGYQPGENASYWLGYRALGMDFDHAGGKNRLAMSTTTHGPLVGLVFHY